MSQQRILCCQTQDKYLCCRMFHYHLWAPCFWMLACCITLCAESISLILFRCWPIFKHDAMTALVPLAVHLHGSLYLCRYFTGLLWTSVQSTAKQKTSASNTPTCYAAACTLQLPGVTRRAPSTADPVGWPRHLGRRRGRGGRGGRGGQREASGSPQAWQVCQM
jgi:hypothetical protein